MSGKLIRKNCRWFQVTFLPTDNWNGFLLKFESADQSNQTFSEPPFKYRDGPHPLISGGGKAQLRPWQLLLFLFVIADSLFSLIIFIYVSVTFLYIFYAFCWRTEVHKPMPDGRVSVLIIVFFYQKFYFLLFSFIVFLNWQFNCDISLQDLPMITEMLDTVQQKDSNMKEEA